MCQLQNISEGHLRPGSHQFENSDALNRLPALHGWLKLVLSFVHNSFIKKLLFLFCLQKCFTGVLNFN